MLARRDAMVRAPTGSGKTLAYLVPIIQDLATQSPRLSRAEGTHALVIAPTRELCLQIHDVAMLLLKKYHWLVPGLVIGGENRVHEKARLRKGVTLLVATPGRLMDHLESTSSFKIGELRWLILDEADRLLDLGFEAKLKAIIEILDKKAEEAGTTEHKRTTALLSATLHDRLTGLAAATLHKPATIGFNLAQSESGLQLSTAPIGDGDESAEAGAGSGSSAHQDPGSGTFHIPSQLRQCCVFVECRQRLLALAGLIRQKLLRTGFKKGGEDGSQNQGRKAVVFLSSCDGVELHYELLVKVWEAATGAPLLSFPGSSSSSEPPVYKLHGDMPQSQRTANFLGFTQAHRAVLLCTDVAARGLDFPDVTHILQYDVPGAPAE
ncbi:P-loop containing nucleoside triphosphate hydrolase protein [Dunaliella salina]|uniref:ATP-dependent RNA helicase n=1 Tax=Dunaliella salina TaxID=3046 RepID=A0ABQ7GBE7_DUNSA|nr:P-loop containing nucleoside triphosphate hydrolase protein [Dunaliella salina]|eukprot:KAF5831921.1 P-loop containing nucleoside triphosphate hydrolase protein [Dunaliella salina]